MIKVSGNLVNPDRLFNDYSPNTIAGKIVTKLTASEIVYHYSSFSELDFELELRTSIVNASKKLYRSNISFTTFRKSRCNPYFWERTDEGGFLLKDEIAPSSAINDIFINGRRYGTECATAIVIIFYKAILDVFPEELFNEIFHKIHLLNWHYLNKYLGVDYYVNETDYLPGDCRYFKNPDVNPITPEWQGENAIDLGDGYYYGHGIGIRTKEEMIDSLNRHRKPESENSAYLIDGATRPDFKYLFQKYYSLISMIQSEKTNLVWVPYRVMY